MFRLNVGPVTFFSIFGFVVCDSNWEWLAFAAGAWSHVETNEFDVGLFGRRDVVVAAAASSLLPLDWLLFILLLFSFLSLSFSLVCVCLSLTSLSSAGQTSSSSLGRLLDCVPSCCWLLSTSRGTDGRTDGRGLECHRLSPPVSLSFFYSDPKRFFSVLSCSPSSRTPPDSFRW